MADPDTHQLLLYAYVDDMAERRGPYREAHLQRIRDEREAGRIVMAGAFGDPPSGGAMAWRNTPRAEIERFVADDPYNAAGLVVTYRIEPWTLV